MSDTHRIVAALAIIVGGLTLFNAPKDRAAEETPAVGGPELGTVFAANRDAGERKQHAGDAKRVFAIAAEAVEWDGTQATADRVLSTAAQIDQSVVITRKLFNRGWSFSQKYPGLGPAVGDFLKTQLGSSLTGELTDAARADWVRALRGVSAGCARVEAQ